MADPNIVRSEVQLLQAIADTGKDSVSPYRDGHRPWRIVRGGQGWKSATFYSLAERGFLEIKNTAFCGIDVSLTDAGRAVLSRGRGSPGFARPTADGREPTAVPQADPDVEQLLDESSLGSEQALAIRARTPAAASERFARLLDPAEVPGTLPRNRAAIDVGYLLRDDPPPPPGADRTAWLLRAGFTLGGALHARRVTEADEVDPKRTNPLLGAHLIAWCTEYEETATRLLFEAVADDTAQTDAQLDTGSDSAAGRLRAAVARRAATALGVEEDEDADITAVLDNRELWRRLALDRRTEADAALAHVELAESQLAEMRDLFEGAQPDGSLHIIESHSGADPFGPDQALDWTVAHPMPCHRLPYGHFCEFEDALERFREDWPTEPGRYEARLEPWSCDGETGANLVVERVGDGQQERWP